MVEIICLGLVKRIERIRIGVGVGVIIWVGVRVTVVVRVGVRNMFRIVVEIMDWVDGQ